MHKMIAVLLCLSSHVTSEAKASQLPRREYFCSAWNKNEAERRWGVANYYFREAEELRRHAKALRAEAARLMWEVTEHQLSAMKFEFAARGAMAHGKLGEFWPAFWQYKADVILGRKKLETCHQLLAEEADELEKANELARYANTEAQAAWENFTQVYNCP